MGLELAYSCCRDIIGRRRPVAEIEHLDVAVEVERLRLDWRPERVRVVVLAESHVWTSRDEIRSCVTLPNGKETGFARFVYCLGYGEKDLVKRAVLRNSGTPQFWKLFHDTAYEPNTAYARLMKKGERDGQKRVQNKLDLLEKMKSSGIWLIDASVTALYHKGTKLAAGRAYHDVLKACWESHIGEVVCRCAPSAILIVGKGVDDAIGDCVHQDLGRDIIKVIHQPNAHISADDRNRDRRTCFEWCCRHRA